MPALATIDLRHCNFDAIDTGSTVLHHLRSSIVEVMPGRQFHRRDFECSQKFPARCSKSNRSSDICAPESSQPMASIYLIPTAHRFLCRRRGGRFIDDVAWRYLVEVIFIGTGR
jgi:hypothetical protein